MPLYEAVVDSPQIHKVVRFSESDIESAESRLTDLLETLVDTHVKCGVYEVKP